jgi:hypothetical protein
MNYAYRSVRDPAVRSGHQRVRAVSGAGRVRVAAEARGHQADVARQAGQHGGRGAVGGLRHPRDGAQGGGRGGLHPPLHPRPATHSGRIRLVSSKTTLSKLEIHFVQPCSFFFESERGLFPNTEFVYDLELPLDFVPNNSDGEVESFELLPAKARQTNDASLILNLRIFVFPPN